MSSTATADAAVSAPDASQQSFLQQAMLLLTVTFVTMLYAMTVTIANVSLPQMQGSLSSTPDQIAWIVTFNIVATAAVTPIAGWLAARFGRRRLMIWSIIGFGVSTVLCGLATSVPELVIYRIFQGGFGAPLVPLSQAIVLESFHERIRSRVMSIWGTGVIMGPIIAPAIGGALSEAYSWRYVFFMLVPFTVVALIGVMAFIKRRDSAEEKPQLDWLGFGALVVMITGMQLMLDRGERAAWFSSFEIMIYAGFALAGLWVFIVRNFQSDKPFVNPVLLGDRNFVVGLILIFIFGMLNFTPITLLPTLLQQIQGYPDSIIGQILSARGAGTFVGFFLMVFMGKVDQRIPITAGLVLQAWSGWVMAGFDVTVSTSDVLWASAIQGFGVGLFWVPLTIVTFATLDKPLVPDGTAIFHLLRNMGSSIFISISIALVIRQGKTSYAEMMPHISPFAESIRMPGMQNLPDLDEAGGLARIGQEAARQATMIGYIDGFLLFAATAALAIPLVALVKVPKAA
ncbi:MAG: DHA2 family efflux MFS transporter permease subunit [Pseudomonadota bacterium]